LPELLMRQVPSSLRVAVIADDLTGAADAGVQFTRAGYRTAVALPEASLPPAPDVDAVAVDTESRALPAAEAAARVAAVARALEPAPVLFKKIDSLLRGPLGAEVRAAADGGERPRMVVAPAFPAAGRTTRGGVQWVHGRPAERADVARRLAEGGCEDVVVLSRIDLADPRSVATALRRHECVVADAEHDDDLGALVRGVDDPTAVLWAGSAGLAGALGAVHAGPDRPETPAGRTEGTVLVVIGSASPVTREQVHRLVAAGAAVDIGLDLDDGEAAARSAAEALAASRSVVIHTTALDGSEAACGRIAGSLANVVAPLAEDGLVHALVLSGGETAVHVARALGAVGLMLERELEPGVPVGRLIGPRPLPVVSKAGGFGGPMTLVHAVEALGGRP